MPFRIKSIGGPPRLPRFRGCFWGHRGKKGTDFTNGDQHSWIDLGDDEILSLIFKRMMVYSGIFPKDRKKSFEPLNFARKMWIEKSKLPKSYEAFLIWTAHYHHNNSSILKLLCKKHLGYELKEGGELIKNIKRQHRNIYKIQILFQIHTYGN